MGLTLEARGRGRFGLVEIPSRVQEVCEAFQAWREAPGPERLAALYGAFDVLRESGETWRWRDEFDEGSWVSAAVVELLMEVNEGRRIRTAPRTLAGWWERGGGMRERQLLYLAFAGHPEVGPAALRTPFVLPDRVVREWLTLLGHGAPGHEVVLGFIDVFLETRPRALWMKAAEALARLAVREPAARVHVEGLIAEGRGEAYRSRHVRYLRCCLMRRVPAGDAWARGEEAGLANELIAVMVERGAADQSNVLDGLRQLARGDAGWGVAERCVGAVVRGEVELQADRQVEHGLRRLWDVLVAGKRPGSESLARGLMELLLRPRWQAVKGAQQVDAMWAWLETAHWWHALGQGEAVARMRASAGELTEAMGCMLGEGEEDADLRLQGLLPQLLDPVERMARHARRARVAMVEALTLLHRVLEGESEVRWTALLEGARAPAPRWVGEPEETVNVLAHPRAGAALDASGTTRNLAVSLAWKDLCLRLFFAGVAPATMLRDEPLDERDLLRISRALRAAREGAEPGDTCDGLEVGALPGADARARRENEILRHVAVEAERRLAVLGAAGVDPSAEAAARGRRGQRLPSDLHSAAMAADARLRLLWQHMEHDPERAFFRQLHACLRGRDTALHRFVKALEAVDEARVVEDAQALQTLVAAFAEAEAAMAGVIAEAVEGAAAVGRYGEVDAAGIARRAQAVEVFGALRRGFGEMATLVHGAIERSELVEPREVTVLLGNLFADGAPAREAPPTATAMLRAITDDARHRGRDGHGGGVSAALQLVPEGSAMAWHRWLHPEVRGARGACSALLHAYHAAWESVVAAGDGASSGQIRQLHSAETALAGLRAEAMWPLRTLLDHTIHLLGSWRVERENRVLEARKSAAEEARVRAPLEAWEAALERALTRGDEAMLLAILQRHARGESADDFNGGVASNEGVEGMGEEHAQAVPKDIPDELRPVPQNLNPDLAERVHSFLLHVMNLRAAYRLRRALGDRVSLPGEWEPFKPLLAGTLVGPVLILDVGDEWNGLLAEYADNWAQLLGIMTLSVIGSFAMITTTIRPGIPASRDNLMERTMRRVQRALQPFLGAMVLAFVISGIFLATLWRTEIIVWEEPKALEMLLQVSLWGVLSLFLSILIGVLLQGRRMTK